MDDKLSWALRYVERGFAVLPLHFVKEDGSCSCNGFTKNCKPGKHPFARLVPKGLQNATTSRDVVVDWWKWGVPSANIGILTGHKSKLLVIDHDADHDTTGAMDALIARYPVLSRTLRQITPSGGHHYLLSYEGSDIRPSQGVIGTGIDVRAEDSYIVAAPSNHVKGVYAWERGKDILPCPPELSGMLRAKQAAPAIDPAAVTPGEIIPRGQQRRTLLAMGGIVARYGGTESEIRALVYEMAKRCEGGADMGHVEAIVKACSSYAGKNRRSITPEKSIISIVAEIVKNAGVEDAIDYVPVNKTIPMQKAAFADELLPPTHVNGHSGMEENYTRGHDERAAEFKPLSDTIFPLLPKWLRRITSLMEHKHERDLFITGAMPILAGCMPRAFIKYGGHWHRLNIYTCVVAGASQGKGKLRLAHRLADKLDTQLYEESRIAQQEWKKELDQAKLDDDEERVKELEDNKPPFKRFYLAGDTSAARIKESLHDTPHGVIFETEAKSMAQALNNEWGQFRDVLLKSFHNEPVSVDRKFQLPMKIPAPAMGICLSGTPGSFEGILKDTEDGLFSRIMFYYFETPVEFSNQFETRKEAEVDRLIDELSERLPALYHILDSRGPQAPLILHLSEENQARILDFGTAATNVVKRGSDMNLVANVRRSALVAIRISAVLATFDAFMQGRSLSELEDIEIPTDYVRAGILMAGCYLEHALRLAEAMQEGHEAIAGQQMVFHSKLPEGDFTTQDAYKVGQAMKPPIAKRTVSKYLDRFERNGQIQNIAHGIYRKPEQRNRYVSLDSVIKSI